MIDERIAHFPRTGGYVLDIRASAVAALSGKEGAPTCHLAQVGYPCGEEWDVLVSLAEARRRLGWPDPPANNANEG